MDTEQQRVTKLKTPGKENFQHAAETSPVSSRVPALLCSAQRLHLSVPVEIRRLLVTIGGRPVGEEEERGLPSRKNIKSVQS